MRRALAAIRLLLRFIGHCLKSGISTARIIVRRAPPPSGLVRLQLAPMSETGAAVLGALITLTPGSSAIDIDAGRGEILLHLLDTRQAEVALAAIRRDFEADIRELFPETRS